MTIHFISKHQLTRSLSRLEKHILKKKWIRKFPSYTDEQASVLFRDILPKVPTVLLNRYEAAAIVTLFVSEHSPKLYTIDENQWLYDMAVNVYSSVNKFIENRNSIQGQKSCINEVSEGLTNIKLHISDIFINEDYATELLPIAIEYYKAK